jgi:hypothetical protein
MNTIDFLHFLAYLIIAGALIRTIEMHWPDSWVGRALGVIY